MPWPNDAEREMALTIALSLERIACVTIEVDSEVRSRLRRDLSVASMKHRPPDGFYWGPIQINVRDDCERGLRIWTAERQMEPRPGH